MATIPFFSLENVPTISHHEEWNGYLTLLEELGFF
jgi:hypothetical protein